jgi:hypothetical protein
MHPGKDCTEDQLEQHAFQQRFVHLGRVAQQEERADLLPRSHPAAIPRARQPQYASDGWSGSLFE